MNRQYLDCLFMVEVPRQLHSSITGVLTTTTKMSYWAGFTILRLLLVMTQIG